MKTISKDKVRYSFDPAWEAEAFAESGETVCFQTQDCYSEQIDVDYKDFSTVQTAQCNPVTGPLYVNGAQPGDVLKVDILDIVPHDHGSMRIRPGIGVYELDRCLCRRFPIRDGKVLFDNGIDLPIRPMIGVIGTCPTQPIDTETPGEHGGNMDIKDLGSGSTVYLPVAVPGALLSMGDCHALQGDGESAICGMEISASVTVRVTVLKDAPYIPTPFVETADSLITTYAHESLDEASVAAARKMHEYLIQTTGLDRSQAAMLLSLAGELRISQVVNPKKGCIMQFPKEYLTAGNRT